MVDYTDWKVNDVVNICVSVTAFCGTVTQGLMFGSNAISKDPDVCATTPGTTHCPITVDNVGITFKLVKGCNNTNTPTIIYRDFGQFYTNANGQTGVQFTVLNPDLEDYNSSGGSYQAMMVITDSKGQDIIQLSKCTNAITISPPSEKWKCVDPVTNTCVRDDTIGTYNSEAECKAALSCQPPSGATHYIDYDLSFLPTSFLDLVNTYISDISNDIGEYVVPLLSSNITYITSTYLSTDKKFRVYVHYTPAISGLDIGHRWSYDSLAGITEMFDLVNTLVGIAELIGAALIFLASVRFLRIFGPWGLVASAVLSVVGAVVIDYQIKDILAGLSTADKTDVPPNKQIPIVRDIANDTRANCVLLYPGCNVLPPTCSTVNIQGYNKCRGAVDIAQYTNDEKQAGTFDQSKVDALVAKVINTDTCLANGTCTPSQAKTDIDNRSSDINANSQDKQTQTTCDTGLTYDSTTKKCVLAGQCAIRNPFGGCILSSGTASSLLLFGGLIIGGYVIMSYSHK